MNRTRSIKKGINQLAMTCNINIHKTISTSFETKQKKTSQIRIYSKQWKKEIRINVKEGKHQTENCNGLEYIRSGHLLE